MCQLFTIKAEESSSSTGNSAVGGSEDESFRSKNRKGLHTQDYLKLKAERMDNTRAQTLEKFDEENGLSLSEYLVEFQNFCMENIKEDCKNWIEELGSNLSGKLLEAFKQFKMYCYTYPQLEKKFLQWYEDMEEVRKALQLKEPSD